MVNTSTNETFREVVDARISRRGLIGGSIAGAAMLSGVGSLVSAVPARAHDEEELLGFEGIPVSSADTVVVPPGYTARVLIAWGDPVSDGPAFAQDASNSAADQAQQWGMHNDGVVYFPIKGSKEGLLVQNSEYTDDVLLFPDGTANWNAEKTAKSQNAHGVNIIHLRRRRDGWEVVRPSRYARRITGQTPMDIGGPLGTGPVDPRLITPSDPTGRRVLGTINNCAMGFTPWGTYLACEENFNGYFRKTAAPTPLEQRYGIPGSSALWHRRTPGSRSTSSRTSRTASAGSSRSTPSSRGRRRSSAPRLGRLKHEGAWVQEARDGRIVVYTGDDQIFEYIYRYVSNLEWRKALQAGHQPARRRRALRAKFNADGTGEWLPLTPDNPALAGVDAQRHPDQHPRRGRRRRRHEDGPPGVDRHVPRPPHRDRHADQQHQPGRDQHRRRQPAGPNPYGHIVRWAYEHDFTEPTFWWDIFALAGDPAA